MPLALDRSRTAALAKRFAEAADLVSNEFDGLDLHRQYRNAFARVLKWDPLGRVTMLGTDQRDLFVPVVRRVLARRGRPGGALLDVGCGDGQTFALLADAVPEGTTVAIADPDAAYVTAYGALLDGLPHLRAGRATVAEFEAMEAAGALPADGTMDVVLALHMIYFVADPGAMVARLVRLLRPGGALVVVVADEEDGYGARAFTAHAATRRGDPAIEAQAAAMAARTRLFNADGRGLQQHLATAFGAKTTELELVRQPSRLYGHSLADLIALANIANLATIDGTAKFAAVAALLSETPEAADLRIEDEGPRTGMLSVTQPQVVATIVRRA